MLNILVLVFMGLSLSLGAAEGTPVVNGKISSDFGSRIHPITKTKRFHSGVDISAPFGTSIRALAGGMVIYSGPYRGYGNLVVLDHGKGVTTHYAHCWATKVKVGQRLKRNTVLGYVGDTGLASGPHLHFEIRKDGKAIDPASYTGLVNLQKV